MSTALRSMGLVTLGMVGILVTNGHVAQGQGRGTVSSASGGFQVTFGGQTRTIQFTAQKDSTNTTRGEGHLFNHVTGTKLHLEIDCLHVVGNIATVSGTFSHSNTTLFPEEMPFWLQVVDNGEGERSRPT